MTTDLLIRQLVESEYGVHSHKEVSNTDPFKLATFHPNQRTSNPKENFIKELLDLEAVKHLGASIMQLERMDTYELDIYLSALRKHLKVETDLAENVRNDLEAQFGELATKEKEK